MNRTAPLAAEPTPYKMIRTTNVRDGFIDTDNVRYVDETTFGRWTRRAVPLPGDVVLTREAPLGEVGIIRKAEPVFLGQRLIMYRAAPEKLDPYFLMYSMLGDFVQGQIRGYGSGATVEHMRLPDCLSLQLRLPPLGTQRKIAAILSAYDDLIESNNRRIKILEEMAQRIYREWFVDFRFPGHRDMPMAESELGMVPRDWRVGRIDELCSVHKRPFEAKGDAELPLLDMARMRQGSLAATAFGDPSELTTSRIVFEAGDLLFGAIRPNLRKVTLAPVRGVTNTSVLVIRPDSPRWHAFVVALLSSEPVNRWATQRATGTKMPVISWKELSAMATLLPTEALADAFSDIAAPLLEEVQVLSTLITRLKATRDLLLPQLISGQVDVAGLEISVPEVAA
ncbi:MAG TPA: restriction endonuclease subunit S [Solirubrobacteraceae bacterium]|nr:restriction endonuclease subunit S [Solirubrobacteraceae bacterium]